MCEGDLPVKITGTVDTDVPGTYELVYSAVISGESRVVATRTVTVVEAQAAR
jgi:hypothetical protein